MYQVAIVGAGPLGGTLAATLAHRSSCARVVLIDETGTVAAGKALDLLQSCPIAGSDVFVVGDTRPESVDGSDLIVVADRAADGAEWQGEAALALVARLARVNPLAPVVLAGAAHAWLVGRSVTELRRSPGTVIGSAPVAFEAAVRAVTAIEADVPVTDVALQVVGQLPGNAAVLWEQGLVAGVPAVQRVGGGAMRRVESRLEALWPPAPYALASAAAAVIRCVLTDARKTMTCTTLVPRTPVAVARPARLGRAGIVELVPFPETTRLRSLLG